MSGDLGDVTVLIPAAGRVPEGLLGVANVASPAMIPVADRPVIHWTLSYLRSIGLRRFVIAVARRGTFLEDFVECTFGGDCEIGFVVPERDTGVGRTVHDLLARATTNRALVVLGDTYFQFQGEPPFASPDPFVLVHPVDESYRWCIAETDADGRVRALRDKEPSVPAPIHALIGVYYFPDVAAARQVAAAAVEAAESAGRSTELAPLLTGLAARGPIRAVGAGDWLDVGNPDRQASAHRTMLQKRVFNELAIDAAFGTITKRSRHVDKFVEEIDYLRLLPPNLAVLFPRVLGYSTDWNDPWLTMEYYGYPSLSGLFVFHNIDPSVWAQVFKHLRTILTDGFMAVKRPIARDALHTMCVIKTRDRLRALQGPPELVELVRHEGQITLNGRQVANLPLLWPRIEREIERMSQDALGAVIHGDFCLSNILYDFRSRICKLVDPRGSFGTPGIYGDPRYDAAKLYHSVYGLYDFIVHDLFDAHVDGLDVRLDIRTRPYHQEIQRRLDGVLFPTFDRRDTLLLTALLFASMPTLHYDAPRRQLAMYARALQLLDEWNAGAK